MLYILGPGAKPQILVDMTFLVRGEEVDIYQDPGNMSEHLGNIGLPSVVVDVFGPLACADEHAGQHQTSGRNKVYLYLLA